MSVFSELMEAAKSSERGNELILKDGPNVIRMLASPIQIREAFVAKILKGKDGAADRTVKFPAFVYEGCGYEQAAKTSFLAYVLDANDLRNDDGTLKIKTMTFGFKILEGFAAQDESSVAMGGQSATFPMTLDSVIRKSGKGKTGTTYSVSVNQVEANNPIKVNMVEVDEALVKVPSLKDWYMAALADTKADHEKNGKPFAQDDTETAQEVATVDAQFAGV